MYNQSLVEDLIIKTEEYTKTSYDLSRLKLMDKSSSVISSIAAVLACGIILFISILIASFGLSLYLGELLGKTYYGFFAVGAGYAVLAVFFYFFLNTWVRKTLDKSLRAQLFN